MTVQILHTRFDFVNLWKSELNSVGFGHIKLTPAEHDILTKLKKIRDPEKNRRDQNPIECLCQSHHRHNKLFDLIRGSRCTNEVDGFNDQIKP